MKPRIIVTTALLIALGLTTSSCNVRESNLDSSQDTTVTQIEKVPVEFFSCLNPNYELTVSLDSPSQDNDKKISLAPEVDSNTRLTKPIEHYHLFFLEPGTYILDLSIKDSSEKALISGTTVEVKQNQPLRIVYNPNSDNNSAANTLVVNQVSPSEPDLVAKGVDYSRTSSKCSEAATLVNSQS